MDGWMEGETDLYSANGTGCIVHRLSCISRGSQHLHCGGLRGPLNAALSFL